MTHYTYPLSLLAALNLLLFHNACSPNPEPPLSASYDCPHTADKFSCIELVSVYDGDTITVNIPGVHPLIGQKARIRLAGIDAPELRSRRQCERLLGLKAKGRLHTLLLQAESIQLHSVRRGKYFRIIADVVADGTSVSDVLLQEALVRRYNGGPRTSWCK